MSSKTVKVYKDSHNSCVYSRTLWISVTQSLSFRINDMKLWEQWGCFPLCILPLIGVLSTIYLVGYKYTLPCYK